jgi:hypothetical protein
MKKHSLQNQRGQGVVEFVLLAAISVSISLLLVNFFKSNQLAQKLLGTPWTTLSGMIECGTWTGCGTGKHPSSFERTVSYRPDP